MGKKHRHYHFQIAVRLDMRRKIHLTANSKLRLALVKFRYIKRCFLVKDYLRTTDRKCQDAERLIAFQHPIVAHVWAQFFSWLTDSHQLALASPTIFLTNSVLSSVYPSRLFLYSGNSDSFNVSYSLADSGFAIR